jgi:uncharacterized protein YbjT (DUF2867 family)
MMIQLRHWIFALAIGLTATAQGMDVKQNVLVLGGTGRLGAPIVASLTAVGYTVTVFARSSSDRSRLTDLPVAYIVGDLLDGPSAIDAIDGQTFAYVIDASARGSNPDPFYADAMQNILAALEASEVKQFILHGSIGAGDSAQVFSNATYQRVRKVMQEKTQAERLLKDSGIRYTIIRNGVIKLDGTPATGTAELTEDKTTMGTVTRLDLAALTMHCLGNESCMNKTFHAIDESWEANPGY